jgi:hypothetical protein
MIVHPKIHLFFVNIASVNSMRKQVKDILHIAKKKLKRKIET